MTRTTRGNNKTTESNDNNAETIESSIVTNKTSTKKKGKDISILESSNTSSHDDKDSDVSDEEIDSLVNSSLRLLRKPSSSNQLMSAESFAILNKEIINRGLPSSSYANTDNRKDTSNNLIRKQLDSVIYDETALLAPSLKRIKQKPHVTAGKGWFDIEV